jgi:predicted HTH transcriptional regulator
VNIEVFADRLRVSNPGLPPGEQSLKRLAAGEARSRARNPLVVQGLFWLDLMDERGSGIRRMTRLLTAAGHPAPTFHRDHDALVVGFAAKSDEISAIVVRRPRTDVGQESEIPPREAILREAKAGDITTKICVQRLGLARATAQRLLNQLVEEGLLVSEGQSRATIYRRKPSPEA